MIQPLENMEDLSPVVTYCIAHKDPEIPFHQNTINLEIGKSGTIDRNRFRNIVNCYEYIPYGQKYRRELGSTLGSFAARAHLLESYETLDFAINISSYRTFMLADKRSAQFHDILKLNFITQQEAASLGDLALPNEVLSMWRLPMPINVGSIAGNYEYCHHIEDLNLYLEIAVAEGVLSKEESDALSEHRILLPGSLSVGMMPAQIFCDLNEKLELVTYKFLKLFDGTSRDSYQIRGANFCHERLGSYLLEQEIRKAHRDLPSSLFGYWTRVDENLSYSRGYM